MTDAETDTDEPRDDRSAWVEPELVVVPLKEAMATFNVPSTALDSTTHYS
jgi:hypothetical protein